MRNVLVPTETILHQLFEELLERRPGLLTGMLGVYLDLVERGSGALEEAYQKRAAEFAGLGDDEREAWLDRSWNDFQTLLVNAD